DNKPADYAADNKPYEPRHFLPVSIKGVEENDYAMIMGYPGSTSRYLSAAAVDQALEQSNPDQIQILGQRTSIMKEAMDQSDKVRIALASNYASLMNYYKYLIGQTTMMKRYDVVDEKKEEEKKFIAWANETPERKEEYGSILAEMGELIESNKEADRFSSYLNLGALAADGAKNAYFRLNPLRQSLATEGNPGLNEMIAGYQNDLDGMFGSFFYELDRDMFATMAVGFYQNIPEEFHPEIFTEILADPMPVVETVLEEVMEEPVKKKKKKRRKRKKDAESEVINIPPPPPIEPMIKKSPEEKITDWVHMAYEKSIVTDRDRFEAFLAEPNLEAIQNDPLLQYINSVVRTYRSTVMLRQLAYESQIDNLRKRYLDGMQKMHPDKNFYPDANSTMRITYGSVQSYEPQDGMSYQYYTTLAGVMEKEDPNDPEFVVPAKLSRLYDAKDFGPYGEDGRLEINFLTTNDITGGNSGSPVLNSKGELIGLAFDGNWEAMSSDIHVFPDLKRTIAVDARYVLFIIDKFAGASHLIEEMTVVSE
ncbi:MAG: S46 family peptidase, partial [Bacteroidota bacterium]